MLGGEAGCVVLLRVLLGTPEQTQTDRNRWILKESPRGLYVQVRGGFPTRPEQTGEHVEHDSLPAPTPLPNAVTWGNAVAARACYFICYFVRSV